MFLFLSRNKGINFLAVQEPCKGQGLPQRSAWGSQWEGGTGEDTQDWPMGILSCCWGVQGRREGTSWGPGSLPGGQDMIGGPRWSRTLALLFLPMGASPCAPLPLKTQSPPGSGGDSIFSPVWQFQLHAQVLGGQVESLESGTSGGLAVGSESPGSCCGPLM